MPTATRKAAEPSTVAVARSSPETDLRRWCNQPMQYPRRFEANVSLARAQAITAAQRKWVNGTQLGYYCFRRGDPVAAAWQGSSADIEVVEDCFDSWARLGIGIEFRHVATAEDAQVRIGFDPQDGAWSYVGRDLLAVPSTQERTMNLGWPLASDHGRDTALHEIGHTLGLEHEHLNPNAAIVWNRQAVLDHFGGAPNHWSAQQVEWNVLRRLDPAEARSPNWDAESVMGFAFEPGLIETPAACRAGLRPKGGLSYGDKAWVVEAYPGVRAPATTTLRVGASQLLKLKPGETRCLDFTPPRSRSYDIGTFGRSDAVIVLFELTPDGALTVAADDDCGCERNARLHARLQRGRNYRLGVRLCYAESPHETSLMAW